MKKKILSLFLALAMCLSLLPTAAFAADGAQDSAEPGEEILAPEQLGDPEKDPDLEQEEQQADPSVKQDEAVAAVQALMDALPGEVTADNADELQAQLMAIDAALEELTDEQTAKLDLTRYKALCEALSGLTAVQAETTSGHTGDHGEYTLPEGKTWTGINNITAEMDAGYYYLTDYVTISSTWKPKDGVVLCLNGYGITLSADGPAIQVQPDVTFTLCDCNGSNNGRYSSIRHSGGTNEKYGIGVLVGALDSVRNTAEFNMYGGTISYNTSISGGDVEGGGVTVAGGTFNMYGGTISDNKSLFGKGIGGGVFIANHGTFNMSGGEITQNGAKIGGGVFVGGYYGADATEKEKDANYGGTFHMSGGSITGNTAGGGVYVNYYPTTFTVSGTAQITGNKSGSETSNVYLSKRTEDGQTSYAPPIVVDGTLTGSIGVTTADVGQTVATDVSREAKGCFTPDNSSKYRLQYDNDVQTLTMIAATHENHPICGASCTHDGTHTGESWTPISDLSEIKGNGNYYLTDNVKLTASWTSGSYNGRNVKLCLNGFDIIANVDDSAIKLSTYDGNTLTLCDCVGSGEITHGVKADGSKYTGAGVEVPGTQTFNMYGGTITGNKNTFGGGVLLGNGSTFNMYGGSITGNKADANSTSTSDGLGGGVCAKGVSGGAKITFNMYGGTIEDNTATNRGGGVYVGNDAQFSMSGGSITGNTAAQGGGVYYVASNSLYVSGNVNITGNKGTDGKANNVYVPSSSGTPKTVPFYIAWYVLNEDARIGVRVDDNLIATGEHSPVAQVSVYGDKTNAYHEGNFIPDNGGDYGFKLEEKDKEHIGIDSTHVVNLYNGLHEHPICGETCTDGAHTENLSWTGVSSLSEIKANEDGTTAYYYLTQDVTRTASWTAPDNVVLCLNGYSIMSTASDTTAITVDGTFTLTDCNGSNGVKYFKESTNGRWESVSDYADGVITVNGGVIFHTAGGATDKGMSLRSGKFYMYGGTICGNSGGVYVESAAAMTVSGNATITGNAGELNYNVYLNGVITVGGEFGADAKIGVTTSGTNISAGNYKTVAQSADDSALTDDDKEHFESDRGYTPQIRNGKIVFVNGVLHEHPLCGATCAHAGDEKHTDVTWTPLTSQNGVLYRDGYRVSTTSSNSGLKTVYYILPAGNYYLPESITIDKPILISSNMNLCLNGNTLSTTLDQGRQDLTLIAVYQDKTLNLCDCDAEGKGTLKTENNLTFGVEIWYPFTDGHTGGTFNMYGGTITGVQRGVRLYVESKGGKSTFKMYGGKITGTKRGVYINDGSIFEMYGGEITNNDTKPTSTEDKEYFGGGVVVDIGATFTMHGGTISNNNAYSGGGVCLLGKSGSATTTFNMEGGTITGNTTTGGAGGGVYLGTNTAFNMSGDATVSNNINNGNCGGGVYVNDSDSSFTMSGNSTISGNTAKFYGGGVNLAGGTFTMSENAAISGNNAGNGTSNGDGGGVCVNTGTFTMTGGSITGNNVYLGSSAHDGEGGGGVYVARGATAMNISGDVQIKDNWKNGTLNTGKGVYENGSASNLYLFSYDSDNVHKTVTINSTTGLASTAKIGVTTRYAPTAEKPIQIATGAQENVDYTGIFTPDVTGQGYTITQTGNELYLSTHQHSWQYTVNTEGDTITATCTADGCNLTGNSGGRVTIVAPDESTLTYDGNPKEATLEGALTTGVTLTAKDIKYYHKIGEQEYPLETGAKPTNAKSYRAEITVDGKTATVTYEIKKATPQASDFTFTAPGNLTYDGNPKTATVTFTKIDADHIKVKYYQGETVVERPTEAGTYTVKIDVEESGNYNAASDLTNGWTFEIAKNTNTPDVTLSGEMVYKREKIEPTATVKIGNATLVKDQDYTVTYGTNFDAGTNTGVVYIEAKGNYGFTEVIKYFNIAKKTITVTAENKSSRVGQALEKLTYTCDPQPYEGDTFSGELATNANKDTAGTYDITQDTLTLGDNYNIDFKPGTYTVNAKDEQTNFNFAGVENGKVTKVYGADTEFTLAATGAATGSTVTYSSSNEAVATVDGTGKVTIKGAGTAKITATASATDDYAEATAEYTLTVSPKTLTAADLEFTANRTFTKEYDGTTNCTTATVQINSDAKVNNGDALPTVTGTYAYNSKDAKGATKVTFTTERTENTNYILPAGLTVEHKASITQRVLTVGTVTATSKQYDGYDNATFYVTGIELIGTVSGETLKMDATGAPGDYGIFDTKFDSADAGKNKRITGTVTLLGSSALASNYTFEVDGKESSTAPFTATGEIIPADGGSKGSVERTQKFTDGDPKTETIAWQQLLPAGQKWNYSCGYNTSTGTSAHIVCSVDSATGALSYTITGGGAGDQITFTVTAQCNNYDDFTYTVTVRLTARDPQKLEFKGVVNGKVTKTYGDADFTIKATGAATNSSVIYESSDETVATVDSNGKVTIKGAGTATIKAKASATPDYEAKEISYALTVNKLRIPVPTKGTNELEYTGQEQTYLPDGLDTAYCEIESNKATDVIAGGSWHNADVSLKDRSNTEWADGADSTAHRPYPFRITPKPVTVTALDKKITAGQPAPELTSADYTVTGLIGNDTLGGISLYYADPSDLSKAVTPDTGKAGTYAIVVTKGGTGSNNYAPTFVNGTLTIASRPSGGVVAVTYPVNVPGETERGSVSSNVKNASKGSTVTITVEPEDGFQLADLTVTDKDGNELPLTDKGDGKYTFTMPAGKVEVNATFAEKIETSPFADVSTDAYYYEAVKWAAEQGITGGVGGGLFAPDQSCTRAQIVTFLWRAAGSPEPKSMSSFSDVPEDSYYAKAVAWAVENGITVGTSATTFSPDATCTRAQGVTFLFRAAKASADGAPAFRDVAADAYYAAAVKWATDNSVTNGIGGGLFGSDNDCTRAQIVTFLWRLYAGK